MLVLPTVLVWAGVGNFLRLVAIAVGLDWYGRDLSTGYDHELLGIVTFGISAIGLWATEWFVASLLEPFQLAKLRDSAAWREEALPLYLRVNRLLDWPGDGSRFGLESPEEPREPPASNWERRPAILVMGVIVSSFLPFCGGVTLYATSTSLGAVVTNYPALAKEPYRSNHPPKKRCQPSLVCGNASGMNKSLGTLRVTLVPLRTCGITDEATAIVRIS